MRDEYVFQHYVPRLHLRRFFISKYEDNIWCYDKADERIFRAGLDSIAGENFFYDPAEFENPETEKLLQKIEGISAESYDKLLEESSLKALSRSDRNRLALLVAFQFNRTRERRNSIKDSSQQMREALEEKGVAPYIPDDELDALGTEEFAREAQIDTLKEATVETAVIFRKKIWTLIANFTDIPFWTSDHPVTLNNQRDFGPFRGDLGIENRGIEIYFPLSPSLMLVLLDPEDFEGIYSKMPVHTGQIVKQINSLHVYQSTRHIFSRENNFEVAEAILEEHPQLKNPDRQRGEVL